MTLFNIHLSSTTIGLLGIMGSLLVLFGPNANILGRLPTQEGTFNQVMSPPINSSTSSLERHIVEITNEQEAKSFLVWLRYVDDGFAETVDKIVGFPLVPLTAIINILINAFLLYGVFQSKPHCFLPYFFHLLITSILGIIFLSLSWNEIESEKFFLFCMCLHPVESMNLLYTDSIIFTGVVSIVQWFLVIDTCLHFIKLMYNHSQSDSEQPENVKKNISEPSVMEGVKKVQDSPV